MAESKSKSLTSESESESESSKIGLESGLEYYKYDYAVESSVSFKNVIGMLDRCGDAAVREIYNVIVG